MKRKVARFHIQKTKSFPDGAPQREEYNTDFDHENACRIYDIEWNREYECCETDCRNRDCPQHHGMLEYDSKPRKDP